MVTGECPGGDLGDSKKPEWTEKQPFSSGQWHYYLGYASEANNEEEARNIAYKNALLEAGKREFPEFVKISEQSKESLKNTTYQKNFDATELSQISFTEIEPGAKDSPYLLKSAQTNCKIKAYVVLRWSTAKIADEKARLKKLNQELSAGANESNASVGDIESGSGVLEIKTTPPKAQIIIDGEPYGPSNLILKKISVGKHQIMLQKPGYKFEERDVFIEEGKTQTALFQLVKIESAITITTKPAGASVFLNGKPYGVSDNATGILKIDKLSPGEYIPRIEKFDYETLTGNTIQLGEVSLELVMQINLANGSATFLTNVPEVAVECDGRQVGTTSKAKLSILKVKNLKGGYVTCSFTKENYEPRSLYLEIRASAKRSYNVTTEPKTPEVKIQETIKSYSGAEIEANRRNSYSPVLSAQNSRDIPYFYAKPETISTNKIIRYSLYFCTGIAVYGGVTSYISANTSYAKYKQSKTKEEAQKYRSESESYDGLKLMSFSFAALFAGSTLFFSDPVQTTVSHLNTEKPYSIALNLNANKTDLIFVVKW